MAPRRADPPDPPDPDTALADALERAQRHARNALAEMLEAGRALLDAAALATTGATASRHPFFAQAETWIGRVSRSLADDERLPGDVVASLAVALDAEIGRWEERARSDDDARAVLRAFLGLRELLWELGVRAPEATRSPTPSDGAQPAASSPRPARRVERVSVQG